MRNVYVLETFTGDKGDSRLFQWAKKIESIGNQVAQIWEAEYPEEVNARKGINFNVGNEHKESILLCLTDNSVYVEVEEGLFSSGEYLDFLKQICE